MEPQAGHSVIVAGDEGHGLLRRGRTEGTRPCRFPRHGEDDEPPLEGDDSVPLG